MGYKEVSLIVKVEPQKPEGLRHKGREKRKLLRDTHRQRKTEGGRRSKTERERNTSKIKHFVGSRTCHRQDHVCPPQRRILCIAVRLQDEHEPRLELHQCGPQHTCGHLCQHDDTRVRQRARLDINELCDALYRTVSSIATTSRKH